MLLKTIEEQKHFRFGKKSKKDSRSHRDLNSDRWIQSPEC